MEDNIIEIIKIIVHRHQMFFEKKSSESLFRFLDGYCYAKIILKIKTNIDYFFWDNFSEYIFNKFNIIDKHRTIEQILNSETNNDEIKSFELFSKLFNEFYEKNIDKIQDLSKCLK